MVLLIVIERVIWQSQIYEWWQSIYKFKISLHQGNWRDFLSEWENYKVMLIVCVVWLAMSNAANTPITTTLTYLTVLGVVWDVLHTVVTGLVLARGARGTGDREHHVTARTKRGRKLHYQQPPSMTLYWCKESHGREEKTMYQLIWNKNFNSSTSALNDTSLLAWTTKKQNCIILSVLVSISLPTCLSIVCQTIPLHRHYISRHQRCTLI